MASWGLPFVWVVALFFQAAVWLARLGMTAEELPVALLAVAVVFFGVLVYTALRSAFHAIVVGGATKRLVLAGATAAAFLVSMPFMNHTADPVRGVSVRDSGTRLPAQVPPSTASRPNLVLIVLDTVRADHMSCYGYSRQTTPEIDAFAADARLYANVLSPGSWTLPSHASMFTGLPGSAHGCNWMHVYLDDRFETLAERLQAAGYQTVGLSSNPILSRSRNFHQGFDTYWTTYNYANSLEVNERLGRWFEETRQPDRPFFIFLNYIDAHSPYVPASHLLEWSSEDVAEKWKHKNQNRVMIDHMLTRLDRLSAEEIAELEALYDGEIAAADKVVGEFLAFLRDNNLYDNTVIVVTSDHGEHFGEHHMMFHHYSLYEPLVRVPLIIRFPSQFEPGIEEMLVQSHDVFPTALELAGVAFECRPEHNCRSLVGTDRAKERLAVAEYLAPAASHLVRVKQQRPRGDYTMFLRRIRAMQIGRMKLIQYYPGSAELFDLGKDPLETVDLSSDNTSATTQLRSQLESWLGSFEHYQPLPPESGEERPLDEDEIKAMRGLGYM
jgi:arylsulfatase A-like enzyme